MADASDETRTMEAAPGERPRLSVKLSPVGRVQRFLLPELALDGAGWSAAAPAVALPPEPTAAAGDRAAGDRAPGDRAPGDRALGGHGLTDRAPTDRAVTDHALGDRGLRDRALSDDGRADRALAGRAPGESARGAEGRAQGDTAAHAALPAGGSVWAQGESVVVRTFDGPAIGRVVRSSAAAVEARNPSLPAGQVVLRRATEADVVLRLKQQQRERDGHRFCSRRIRERGLAMKLSRVEHAFDGARLIFFFTADGRIDFRELVRDLAAEFRMRIEMRQIGVRDEARMLGGYGSCGRPLCCTTWLQSFEPVSIKMAKQQNLSLNPSKLSGLCGRLKCCLRYELPNGKGESFAGCAQQGGCSGEGCAGGGSCGSGGCGACGT